MEAYVLIIVRPGQEKEVLKKLLEFPIVVEAKPVYGEYDIVLKVKVENIHELREFVFETLRRVQGIEKTTTLICAE